MQEGEKKLGRVKPREIAGAKGGFSSRGTPRAQSRTKGEKRKRGALR